MTTEQQFINYLNKQGYIDTPTDFFYTNAPESLPLVEGLRMIYLHNKNIIETLREENITLTQTLNIQTQYPSPKKEEPVKEIPQEEILPRKEIKVLDLLTHTNDLTTITKIIDQSTKEEKPYIKLYYYKKLQDTKLELLHIISTNPLSNTKDIISRIEEYSLILEYLNPEEEQIKEDNNPISNIIIIPNKKQSSYLYDDILRYLSNSKEIKNTLDKILNSYYGKDTKSLKGYTNLYEYTHPNGIRILYVVLPNNKIGICSLFYKDKNKSIKITNYYEEALNRYKEQKEYILENINNPDFYISQAEIIAEIYTKLESNMPLSLKKEAE